MQTPSYFWDKKEFFIFIANWKKFIPLGLYWY